MDEMFSHAGHRPSAWRVWNILTIKDVITKEDVGRCMDRNLLHDMLAEMAGEFPALSRVFVAERDLFLAHSLQLAAMPIVLSLVLPDAWFAASPQRDRSIAMLARLGASMCEG